MKEREENEKRIEKEGTEKGEEEETRKAKTVDWERERKRRKR
jgi:hypothetical protein